MPQTNGSALLRPIPPDSLVRRPAAQPRFGSAEPAAEALAPDRPWGADQEGREPSAASPVGPPVQPDGAWREQGRTRDTRAQNAPVSEQDGVQWLEMDDFSDVQDEEGPDGQEEDLVPTSMMATPVSVPLEEPFAASRRPRRAVRICLGGAAALAALAGALWLLQLLPGLR